MIAKGQKKLVSEKNNYYNHNHYAVMGQNGSKWKYVTVVVDQFMEYFYYPKLLV